MFGLHKPYVQKCHIDGEFIASFSHSLFLKLRLYKFKDYVYIMPKRTYRVANLLGHLHPNGKSNFFSQKSLLSFQLQMEIF